MDLELKTDTVDVRKSSMNQNPSAQGESAFKILQYWLPEFIAYALLVSLPLFLDSYWISQLNSTSTYGALGAGTRLMNTLFKLSEAIPVASIAFIGRHNGAGEYEKCGERFGDSFWSATLIGFAQCAILWIFASQIYRFLGAPESMIATGTPYLKLQALNIPLLFIFAALIGFMKALKNTTTPLYVNIIGIALFLGFDYALILGKFGFPQLGLIGSPIASIIRYSFMNIIIIVHIMTDSSYKKYFKQMFFTVFRPGQMLHLLNLSWPVVIDKGILAWSFIWLGKMIGTIGSANHVKVAMASMEAIKNLERFSILPALAFAQVVTFLVSNNMGEKNIGGARKNIKKILIFTFISVLIVSLGICSSSHFWATLFDPNNKFASFFEPLICPIIFLVSLDLVQIILAGALRGAGDVRSVMMIRTGCCLGIFVPISYIISQFFVGIDPQAKFMMIYTCYYLTTAVMGIAFYWRIKGTAWQKKSI